MEINPDQIDQSDYDLIAAVCQYHAQLLDRLRGELGNRGTAGSAIPRVDQIVPSDTVLYDGTVDVYMRATGALTACGFAKRYASTDDQIVLLYDSDQFTSDKVVRPQSDASLRHALAAIFMIYTDMEKLGPPDTLGRIYDLLFAAGFTEIRFGHLEWSQKAHKTADPRRLVGLACPEDNFWWNTDLFDWYLQEAAFQWSTLT
jgi:hypothetical protein